MLFFDHFYHSLESGAFDELKEFFCSYPGVESYVVNSNDGVWEGIYPFVQKGSFPEFVRHSDRNPLNQIGLAFSNTNKTDLHEALVEGYPEAGFVKEVKTRGDGSPYYISSNPVKDWNLFYLWVLDWQGEPKQKRESVWGKNPENPFISVEELSLKLLPENFEILKAHSDWMGEFRESDNRAELEVPQYHGENIKIIIFKSADKQQDMGFRLKVTADFQLVPTKSEAFSFNEDKLILSYNC